MRIFLAPADPENARQTLFKTVAIRDAAPFLNSQQVSVLTTQLHPQTQFHCFASTQPTHVRRMSRGDVALFTLTGTGRFQLIGTVAGTFESAAFGDHFWPVRPDKSWQYIYTLSEMTPINIDKDRLLVASGYDNPSDNLSGPRPVSAEVTAQVEASGGIAEFVRRLTEGEGTGTTSTRTRVVGVRATMRRSKVNPAPVVAEREALRLALGSGQYRIPPVTQVPKLEEAVRRLVGEGVPLQEAAQRTLAPFRSGGGA